MGDDDMGMGAGLDNETEGYEVIAGDRRADRRYELRLELRWKLIRRRRVLDSGTGKTLDLSSGGILFDAGKQLPEGLNIELSVLWPALLHNVAPLQLFATGRIIRCEGQRIAIKLVQHEFRTISLRTDQRPALAVPARASSRLMSVSSFSGTGKVQ